MKTASKKQDINFINVKLSFISAKLNFICANLNFTCTKLNFISALDFKRGKINKRNKECCISRS